ncbi:MAG TPA: GNAT family N-acetyltransferase [Drouetiella sp.]
MPPIKAIATVVEAGLESSLARKAVAEIAENVPGAAAAGQKLLDEVMAIGAQTQSKGVIKTFSDMVRKNPGEVVTDVPRRWIVGSAEQGLSKKSVTVDILHPDELFARIENQKVNADLLANARGPAELRRLHYLHPDEAREQAHVTLSLGNRIAGIGGVRSSRSLPGELWVDHISVDPAYQGRGYARNIIESIYDYALRRNQQVTPSSFSEMGQRLKPIFTEMNEKFPQAASKTPFRDL